MNKIVFLIPLATGLAIWGVLELFEAAETDNHFEMAVHGLSQDSFFQSIKHVSVCLDDFGSIKHYFDFAGVNNGFQARAPDFVIASPKSLCS